MRCPDPAHAPRFGCTSRECFPRTRFRPRIGECRCIQSCAERKTAHRGEVDRFPRIVDGSGAAVLCGGAIRFDSLRSLNDQARCAPFHVKQPPRPDGAFRLAPLDQRPGGSSGHRVRRAATRRDSQHPHAARAFRLASLTQRPETLGTVSCETLARARRRVSTRSARSTSGSRSDPSAEDSRGLCQDALTESLH